MIAATAARIRALADSRGPTLGDGRLVCIDGPAGSGKTTVAAAIDAPTVHMDDLFRGWDGLATVDPTVRGVVEPLMHGRPGRYQRWDWITAAPAEEHLVAPAPLLVIEGVGAGTRAWAALCTVLVWVESDPVTRLARGIARDGEKVRERWEKWMVDEQELFARERTRARADLVVPT
ncbi:uridine kinase family protein [Nocardioides terrisoli]|uniref:uridine kinase family protein n=1 Tax=Nocardioides terrisoli TaxID=3388267 RepID=UPI00287BAE4B|nr:4-amino-4-deoxy-L-arabinose transferase [Nocardioides marmorisolisilvae]